MKGLIHVYRNSKNAQKLHRAVDKLISAALFGVYVTLLATLILSVLKDTTGIPALQPDTLQLVNEWSDFYFEVRIGGLIMMIYAPFVYRGLWEAEEND